jgi:hypothetical protein
MPMPVNSILAAGPPTGGILHPFAQSGKPAHAAAGRLSPCSCPSLRPRIEEGTGAQRDRERVRVVDQCDLPARGNAAIMPQTPHRHRGWPNSWPGSAWRSGPPRSNVALGAAARDRRAGVGWA